MDPCRFVVRVPREYQVLRAPSVIPRDTFSRHLLASSRVSLEPPCRPFQQRSPVDKPSMDSCCERTNARIPEPSRSSKIYDRVYSYILRDSVSCVDSVEQAAAWYAVN